MPFNIKDESEFIQACAANDLEAVLNLSAQDPALVNTPASNGSYPLMFAAENGHLLLTKKLLELDADLNTHANTKNENNGALSGVTALYFAIQAKQWAMVDFLLEKGSKVDTVVISGRMKGNTPLWMATDNEQWDLAIRLLGLGATDRYYPEGFTNRSVLRIATQKGQWDFIKHLLNKRVSALPDLMPKDVISKGLTPILLATYAERWDIVELLLNKSVSALADVVPTEEPHKGVTTILLAAIKKQWDIVKLLLENGFSVDHPAPSGSLKDSTVLGLAIQEGQIDIIKILLHKGASIVLSKNKFMNRKHLRKIAMRLETNHYPVNCILNAAITLHEMASETIEFNEQVLKDTIQTLCPNKQQPTALNAKLLGKTALEVALEKNKLPIIEALLLAGAKMPTSYWISADSPPIVQVCVYLEELEAKIRKISTTVPGEESKVNAEQLREIKQLYKRIKEMTKALAPKHKNQFRYQLAKMLETALPCIPQTRVVKAYSKIKPESELYTKVAAKLLHYSILGNPQSIDTQESLEESVSEQLTLALEAGAGGKIPSSFLSRLMIQCVLGKEGQVYANNSAVTQPARLSEIITNSCMYLREQFQTQNPGLTSTENVVTKNDEADEALQNTNKRMQDGVSERGDNTKRAKVT